MQQTKPHLLLVYMLTHLIDCTTINPESCPSIVYESGVMSTHAKANILKRSRELNERVVYSAIKTRVSMFRKKISICIVLMIGIDSNVHFSCWKIYTDFK